MSRMQFYSPVKPRKACGQKIILSLIMLDSPLCFLRLECSVLSVWHVCRWNWLKNYGVDKKVEFLYQKQLIIAIHISGGN
jgi:hypothetical protein